MGKKKRAAKTRGRALGSDEWFSQQKSKCRTAVEVWISGFTVAEAMAQIRAHDYWKHQITREKLQGWLDGEFTVLDIMSAWMLACDFRLTADGFIEVRDKGAAHEKWWAEIWGQPEDRPPQDRVRRSGDVINFDDYLKLR